MRISDWSSDVCSSDLGKERFFLISATPFETGVISGSALTMTDLTDRVLAEREVASARSARAIIASASEAVVVCASDGRLTHVNAAASAIQPGDPRSEEYPSELQALMRIWSAVFCL